MSVLPRRHDRHARAHRRSRAATPHATARCPAAAAWFAAALALLLAVPAAAQQEGAAGSSRLATLSGRVLSTEDGRALSDAAVELLDLDREIVTGPAGTFRFEDVEPGSLRVRVRLLGHASRTLEVGLEPSEHRYLTLRLGIQAVEVSGLEVEVESARRRGKMTGFWQRRRVGLGQFWNRAELDDLPGGGLETIWRSARGLTAQRCARAGSLAPPPKIDPNSAEIIRNSPGFEVFGFPGSGANKGPSFIPGCWQPVVVRGRHCTPQVWLDGAPLQDPVSVVDGLTPRDLEGVEIYAGVAMIPGQYRTIRNQCGTVLLWLRTGTG